MILLKRKKSQWENSRNGEKGQKNVLARKAGKKGANQKLKLCMASAPMPALHEGVKSGVRNLKEAGNDREGWLRWKWEMEKE
jgi:hypothetical protein